MTHASLKVKVDLEHLFSDNREGGGTQQRVAGGSRLFSPLQLFQNGKEIAAGYLPEEPGK